MSVRRRSRTVAALGALALLVTAAPASAAVSGPAAGGPTFVNYVAPGELARDAGEPTLGVNWKTGKVLYQAFTETDQVTFDDRTLPAKATWKDVSRPPTDVISLDPILETDPVTGRTLVSQLAPPCSIAAFTDSDGEPTATNPLGYTPAAACGVGSNFDHQTVHFGRSVNPNPLYGPDRIAWYCSQVVVESTCSVSRTGGVAFEQSRPVYTFKGDLVSDPLLVGCEGLHGHLNSSPVDGTAYLPNFACNSAGVLDVNRPSVVVSPDEGLTWTIRQVPDGTSPELRLRPGRRRRRGQPGLRRLRERDQQPHGRDDDRPGRDVHEVGRPRRAVRRQERHHADRPGGQRRARGRRVPRHDRRGAAGHRGAAREPAAVASTPTATTPRPAGTSTSR